MPEFSLELYRSRSAEIKAQRAQAQQAYETAALAAALDPASADEQQRARAHVADLDAQQEALDAALAKFSRDARRAAVDAKRSGWEKDVAEVEVVAADALEAVESRLGEIAAELDRIAEQYPVARHKIRRICSGHKLDVSGTRPGDIVGGRFNAVQEINRDGGEEVRRALRAGNVVRELAEHFASLRGEGLNAMMLFEPKHRPEYEEAA